MAVGADDVRHVAQLARLGLDDERLEQLVRELSGILAHMEVLAAVDPEEYRNLDDGRVRGAPLRSDSGPQLAMATRPESFAPEMAEGFFLVPRLETHQESGEETA
jgi:aspartyl-tRNA(Asn)/glutamyl-tRNA(Gln) amidotransferase subunit C